jgi:hypothetical protein
MKWVVSTMLWFCKHILHTTILLEVSGFELQTKTIIIVSSAMSKFQIITTKVTRMPTML